MMDQLIIFIAPGEKRLQEALQGLGLTPVMTPMHVGDLMICRKIDDGSENVDESHKACHQAVLENVAYWKSVERCFLRPLVVIERKTIDDFCSSLRSGHKKNQHLRLLQWRDNVGGVQIWYVIEGYEQLRGIVDNYGGVAVSVLETAFLRLTLLDQIVVRHVYNVDEHATIVRKICDLTVTEQWSGGVLARDRVQEYATTLSIQRRANLTPAMLYQQQIACFPGVSMTTAGAISSRFPSWRVLLASLHETPDPVACLAETSVGNRRLGQVRAEEICQSLGLQVGECRGGRRGIGGKRLKKRGTSENVATFINVARPFIRIQKRDAPTKNDSRIVPPERGIF